MKKLTLETVRETCTKQDLKIFEQVLDGRPHLLMTQTNINLLNQKGFDIVYACIQGLFELDGCYKNQADTKFWYQSNQLHRLDGPAIERTNGFKAWYQNNQLHRLDGPAMECSNGTKFWYQNGKLHRLDGPAIEWAEGSKEWYQNGKPHREDGPAVEYANGSKFWYQNGEYHRLDGPAIECADGDKCWYKNGRRHREDGPACEWANGTKEWCQNGKRHRLDGPAVEYASGTKSWWIDGRPLPEEEFKDTDDIPEIDIKVDNFQFQARPKKLKISEANDVEYLRKKLLTALKIPGEYLMNSEDGGSQSDANNSN